MNYLKYFAITTSFLLLFGCMMRTSDLVPLTFLEDLKQAARGTDPDFPDERNLKITRFAYIGTLQTIDGHLLVVDMATVITRMRAPRGAQYILLFDVKGNFVRKIKTSTPPLWCSGAILFLWGLEEQGELQGNAWDFSRGTNAPELRIIKAYGSYLPENEQ